MPSNKKAGNAGWACRCKCQAIKKPEMPDGPADANAKQ